MERPLISLLILLLCLLYTQNCQAQVTSGELKWDGLLKENERISFLDSTDNYAYIVIFKQLNVEKTRAVIEIRSDNGAGEMELGEGDANYFKNIEIHLKTINESSGIIHIAVYAPKSYILIGGPYSLEPIIRVGIDSCTVIDSPGEYVLTKDIINSFTPICINITSSNVVLDGEGHTMSGNYNEIGVYVYNSTTALTNVTVKNLKMIGWNYGIYYNNTSNGSIIYDIAQRSHTAGIYLELCDYNTLMNNTALANGAFGIVIDDSHNNSLINNIVIQNYYGIGLYHSNYNKLINNIVSPNYYEGVLLWYSSNNIITDNNASENYLCGICLRYSNDNLIYNNLFNNFSINSSSNTWNTTRSLGENIIGGNSIGGNAWLKPNGMGFSQICSDINNDSICDEAYQLDASNIDYLPLKVLIPMPTPAPPPTPSLNVTKVKYAVYEETGALANDPDFGFGYYNMTELYGEKYILIKGQTDKLSKLVFEQDKNDTKILYVGQIWDLGEGYSLKVNMINNEGNKIWLMLFKDGALVKESIVGTVVGNVSSTVDDKIFKYKKNLANETDVPLFLIYLNDITRDENKTSFKYAWMISDNIIFYPAFPTPTSTPMATLSPTPKPVTPTPTLIPTLTPISPTLTFLDAEVEPKSATLAPGDTINYTITLAWIPENWQGIINLSLKINMIGYEKEYSILYSTKGKAPPVKLVFPITFPSDAPPLTYKAAITAKAENLVATSQTELKIATPGFEAILAIICSLMATYTIKRKLR